MVRKNTGGNLGGWAEGYVGRVVLSDRVRGHSSVWRNGFFFFF